MGLHDVSLENLDYFNVIIGKNKSGKSSILKLLTNYKIDPDFWIKNKKLLNEESKPIELLKLTWELNQDDISAINEIFTDPKYPRYNFIKSNNVIMVTEHGPPPINHSVKFYSDLNLTDILYESPRVSQKMFKDTILGGKITNLIPSIRYLSVNSEKRITEEDLKSKREDPDTIFYKNQNILIFDQILNWIDIKNREKKEIQEFIDIINELIDIDLEINEFSSGKDFMLSFDYEEFGKKFEKSFRSIGNGPQQLMLILYYCYFQTNHLILIDEIEIGLHPSLQKKMFKILFDLAKQNNIQLIVTSHSPVFLDLCENIYLLEGKDSGAVLYDDLNFIKIKSIDELNEPDYYDAAFTILKYKDTVIKSGFDDLELQMVNNLKNYFETIEPSLDFQSSSGEFKKILQLGTPYRDPKTLILQNGLFLTCEPDSINLNSNNKMQNPLNVIFICQLNALPIAKREKIREKFKKSSKKRYNIERFEAVCEHCWDSNFFKENVLAYTNQQSFEKRTEIKTRLEELKKNPLFYENKGRILLIFPENTIPYASLEDLIDFAAKNEIIIIGGMEHKRYSSIKQEINHLLNKNPGKDYKSRYEEVDYTKIYNNYRQLFINYDDEGKPIFWINQSIIINSNKKFSFQVKNIPVIFYNKDNDEWINENIPPILIPHIKKFRTIVGTLAIFICKDFIVNYETIPEWMDKNKVSICVIPSFSTLVNPFRDKLGEIIRLQKNKNKIFAFASLAEYGGSGVYYYKIRQGHEPSGDLKFEAGESSCKSFIIDYDNQ